MIAQVVPLGRGAPMPLGVATWPGPSRCGQPIMVEPVPVPVGGGARVATPVLVSIRSITTRPSADVDVATRQTAERTWPTAARRWFARVTAIRIVPDAQISDVLLAALRSAEPEGEA